MNLYRVVEIAYVNGEQLYRKSWKWNLILAEEKPQDKIEYYNWSNAVSFCYLADLEYNKSVFGKITIKQSDYGANRKWVYGKDEFSATMKLTYEEETNFSINEILELRAGEKAIQFLSERGLSISAK